VSELKPFDPEKTCPKCGHDDVRTFYERDACSASHGCGVDWHNPQEHLDRVCQRCRHTWAEACLAAATTTAPAAENDAGAEVGA
jgi:hypothetical protein